MKLNLKIDKNFSEWLEKFLIKIHDELLISNKESKFDWYNEEDSDCIDCEITFQNLSKDELQYVIETLKVVENNVKK